MKERLDYIDAIKGFAILLVVMGHVLAWAFSSLSDAQALGKPMLLWNCIYAFHMPLFIFVSGLLFGLSRFPTANSYVTKVISRFWRLIIPYFVCGVLVYLWRGVRPLTYWYLLTLFQLIVIMGGVNLTIDKIKNKKIGAVVECVVIVILYLAFSLITKKISHPWLSAYDWFPHLTQMFPYFALGSFLSRHFDINSLMNNHVFSLSLIFFIALLFVKVPYVHRFQALAGIYCTFYLFVVCFTSGRIVNYLKRIGKMTLYIYIIHFFIDISIVQLGDYFIWLSQTGKMGYVTCFVLQLIYSSVVSVIIIELSLLATKVIKTSKILSFAFFGEK